MFLSVQAYKLDLPSELEDTPGCISGPARAGPGNSRPVPAPDHPPAVEESNDEWHAYEVERLVGRRLRKYGKGKPVVEYLVQVQTVTLHTTIVASTNELPTLHYTTIPSPP